MKRTPFALVARHAVVETEAKKPAGPKMGRIAGVVAFKCSQPSRVRPTHSGQCSTSNDKLNAASGAWQYSHRWPARSATSA